VKELEAHPGVLIWYPELTPDGTALFTIGGDSTIMWSFPNMELQHSFSGSAGGLLSTGEQIFTNYGELHNEVIIWSMKNFEALSRFAVRDDELSFCLMDAASSPPESEGAEIEVEVEGQVVTWTLSCGSPIPPGSVCARN
jgi:hypothetical protein